MDFGVIGQQFQCFPVLRLGVGEVASSHVGDAQVIVGRGVFWVEMDGFLPLFDCGLAVTILVELVPLLEMFLGRAAQIVSHRLGLNSPAGCSNKNAPSTPLTKRGAMRPSCQAWVTS